MLQQSRLQLGGGVLLGILAGAASRLKPLHVTVKEQGMGVLLNFLYERVDHNMPQIPATDTGELAVHISPLTPVCVKRNVP